MKKQLDRHKDPERQSFTLLLPTDHLETIGYIAKNSDKTKGAIIREAVKIYLAKRQAS